jgi:hypothetical protein
MGGAPGLGIRANTLVGEFLHDLRSAFDHLAWQLVLQNGGTPNPEKTNFPVWARQPETQREGKQALPNIPGGISTTARTIVHDAQPYQWGDGYSRHPLWMLHQLWNVDKHRYIVASGGRIRTVFPNARATLGFKFGVRLESADEHGAQFAVVPDDPGMDVDAHLAMQVALDEPEYGIELAPFMESLRNMHEMARAVVTEAEARCFPAAEL